MTTVKHVGGDIGSACLFPDALKDKNTEGFEEWVKELACCCISDSTTTVPISIGRREEKRLVVD
jgi:hypothetical protein